jgi:hypothetical protein
VAAANLFSDSLDSMSWSYLKVRKGVKAIPYHFQNLDGWSEIEQEKRLGEVEELVNL